MNPLCIADHCGILGQHLTDCADPHCRGCLPRPAADGLRLCEVDTRRIAEDARTAAALHDDLALRLMPGGRGGERVATSSTGAPTVDGDVVEARSAIRATLVSLVRIIATERGSQLPPDATEALGAYIAHHSVWLAAHRAAQEHARDLRDIAGDPRTRRLAYPAGSDRLYIGDCPLIVRDLDGVESVCGTRLYQHDGQLLIGCDGCGTDETIEWWQRQIVGEVDTKLDGYAAAAHLSLRWSRPVEPATLRVWATRGRVGRHGQDGKGRTLYDLTELTDQATKAWGEPVRHGVAA